MWPILPNLFLGNRFHAADAGRLRGAGITHIVNCAAELPNHFEPEFTYLRLDLLDPDPKFAGLIPAACAFIDAGRRQGNVLVHCSAAVSRSPATTLAYFCHQGDSLVQAVRRLSGLVLTAVEDLFLHQLAERQGEKLSPSRLRALSFTLLGRG